MPFKKQVILEVSYFTRNIYETETVTSGICYIVISKTQSFLKITWSDFEILWMPSQPIIQRNYIIYEYTFIFEVLFVITFCTSFQKRVHNLKEIVDHISTNKVLLYNQQSIILFILFISSLPFLLFLYTVLWRYKRDCVHASIDILFYIMFYIINAMKKQTLLYHFRTQDTKKVPI